MLKSFPLHQKKSSKYPYKSATATLVRALRAKGVETSRYEWVTPGINVTEKIQSVSGPILEIGGPTDSGFYHLDGVTLPSPVIISNNYMNTQKFAPNSDELDAKTEILIDGRHIPAPDNSLGMVLSAHLPFVDEDKIDFEAMNAEDNIKFSAIIDQAHTAVRHAAETQTIDDEVLTLSLRLGVAHQVFQKLEPGGLYITDCTVDEKNALSAIGYSLLAYLDSNGVEDVADDTTQEPYFRIVLQKPVASSD